MGGDRGLGNGRRPGVLAIALLVLATSVLLLPGGAGRASSATGSGASAMNCSGATECAPSPAPAGPEPVQWRLLAGGAHPGPSARYGAGSAYDPTLSAVVLFGGQSGSGELLGDTWEFVRGGWSRIAPTGPAPSPRWGASMAFDAATGRLVLFGGENASVRLDDTWSFNGTSWRSVTTAVEPSPRAQAAVAYDPILGGIVLFGGSTSSPTPANDTWLFTAGGWQSLTGELRGAPTPLVGPGLAFLSNAASLLLEGAPADSGISASGGPSLWALTGMEWSPLPSPAGVAPSPRADAAFVADPLTGTAVLFGGAYGGSSGPPSPLADTWTYNGASWTNETAEMSNAPSPRSAAAAAFDPAGGGVLLFGGESAGVPLSDTWTYGSVPIVLTVTVSPTAGEAPLNATFQVSIHGGTPPYQSTWTLGDGAVLSGSPNGSHVYEAVGTFQAQLFVNDSAGTNATAVVVIQVLTPWAAAHQWGELSAPATRAPSPRWSAQSSYDPPIDAGVLFGGQVSNGGAANDTWVFVSGVWINLTGDLATSPSPRWGGAMAYDPLGGDIVLFGGTNGVATYNDTWTYSPAVGWQEIPTDTAPSPRVLASFVDDPDLGGDLLFGGGVRSAGGGWTIYNDTWEWRDGTWANLTAALVRGPPPTLGAAISYDPLSGEALMFGGSALPPGGTPGTCYPDAELWVFAADQWSLSTAPNPPSERLLSAAAFLPSDGVALVFGGAEARNGQCGAGGDTWSYENATWSNLSGSIDVTPPARAAAAALYDAAAGVVVLFGGDENGVPLNDTWVYPAVLNESATTSVQQTSSSPPGNPNGSGGGPGNTTIPGSGMFTVGYTISGTGGPAPDTVDFSATETGGQGPFAVSWYFGDSSPTEIGPNVSHTYLIAGSFEAELTVTDALGQTGVVLVGPIVILPPLPGHTGPAAITPAGLGDGWVFAALGAAAAGVVIVAVLVEWRQRRLREEGNEMVREIEQSKNP
jgi:hypothetical protein